MIIIGCSGSVELAERIAKKLKKPFSKLNKGTFPDGEIHVWFNKDVKNKKVVLVQSLYTPPDDKIIEVIFAAHTAKELGAKKVILVAPYLAYMRQDRRFNKYGCISAKVIGDVLSKWIDELITIDPHLHRLKSLNEAYRTKTKRLTANKLIAQYIKKSIKNPLIIGPDEESFQWARSVAQMVGCKSMVLHKTRHDSTHVDIAIKEKVDFSRYSVIMVDDIISTGHTMMEVIKDAKKLGAKKVYCIGVHGIFANDAYPKMKKMGANVVTTNCIPHETNKIDVSGIIAGGLR